ncbi:MAG: hypothetical protein ACKOXV_08500 [Bacteroidota bacterium]
MPTVNKASFLSSSVYIFLLRFFPTAALFICWILLSRNLSLSAYGAYQSWWIYFMLFTSLASVGIPSLLLTYTAEQVQLLWQKISTRSLAFFGLLLLLLSVCCIVLQYHAGLTIAPMLTTLFFMCTVVLVIAETYLIVSRKLKRITVLSILYAIAFVLLHVYYLHTAFDLASIITALTLLLSIRLTLVLIAAYQHYTKRATTAVVAIDLNETRQLWLHLALLDFLQYIFKWIDKVVVVVLLSTSLTAIYFNGSIDIPFLPILLGAFTSAGLLFLAQMQRSNMQQHSIALLHKTGILLNAIVMPLFLFLLFFAAPLFALFFDHRYAASVPIFQWSILVLPLRAYGFTSILQHAHKGAIINKGALLDLLIAVAAMYPLYCIMGLPGLAFSFVLSSYIQAAYYSVYTAKILQVRVLDLFPMKIWLQQIVLSLVLLTIFKIGSWYYSCTLSYLLLVVSISFLFNLIFLWMKKTAIQ